MDVKVFTHIRVLYIFVFGLYFGLFALMYCNFAIWWKVQNIENYSSYIGCNEQIQLNNELSKENVAVQSKSRNKRSRSYRAVSLQDIYNFDPKLRVTCCNKGIDTVLTV